MDEIDIYRSAHALIDQHGNDAGLAAAQRADQLLDEGDMDGHNFEEAHDQRHAWERSQACRACRASITNMSGSNFEEGQGWAVVDSSKRRAVNGLSSGISFFT